MDNWILRRQKNTECSSALLDLMEYHDSPEIPVAVLDEWLKKYSELESEVTDLFYTTVSVVGLPTLYLLNDDPGKYPAIEKFHDVYYAIKRSGDKEDASGYIQNLIMHGTFESE